MDEFFFEKLPFSSQSTPISRHHSVAQEPDEGVGTDHESTSERSSSMSLDESHEQQISSKIDEIGKKVQDLVGQINESRASDQGMMDNFQEKLTDKVNVACQQMKDHMFSVYEQNSHAMEARLAELSRVLENCSKLNAELQSASQALLAINEGLVQVPEQ